MTLRFAAPDPSPPGIRRLRYALACRLIRYPGLLRLLGSFLRFWPAIGGAYVAARRSAVQHVLGRPDSFTNSSHAPNLVAGDFLIGAMAGAAYRVDAAVFKAVLNQMDVRPGADGEAREGSAKLLDAGSSFDLVEDYLNWVVLRALKPGFGAAAEVVFANSRAVVPDAALERRYMHDVRHVAAHLFGGAHAPAEVQRRAEVCAASLRSRIGRCLPEISMSWPPRPAGFEALRRNAIGLAWVSHPVTVQAGALVMQELLGRRPVYARLRARARDPATDVWNDAGFRDEVRSHVLELMRFRPVFPFLARDVPRRTEFESGARRNPVCAAGSSVALMTIAALFDDHAIADAHSYRSREPAEPWQYLMFGAGERQCPAKDEALTILTSALIGLLTLPELTWAERRGRRIGYDGPMISRFRLRPA